MQLRAKNREMSKLRKNAGGDYQGLKGNGICYLKNNTKGGRKIINNPLRHKGDPTGGQAASMNVAQLQKAPVGERKIKTGNSRSIAKKEFFFF